MSTLKTINIIHPSGSTTNIVNDASGNITVGNNITVTGTLTGSTGVMNIGSGQLYKDASGNVGIGTSSPTGFGGTGLNIYNASSYGVLLVQGGTNIIEILANSSNGTAAIGTRSNSSLVLSTNDIERARIDTSGNLLVGTTTSGSARLAVVGSYISVGTSTYAAGSDNVKIANNSSNFSRSSTAATAQIYFENPNGTVGQIQTSGSATAYLTSSDYRLKEDVQPLQIGLSTVSQMRPVSYKWKVDGSIGHGFIAHELQALVPDAVSGEKDAVDEDGKPIHQGVDYSKIVVHLVAAIQEQQATIIALTARVAELEAK